MGDALWSFALLKQKHSDRPAGIMVIKGQCFKRPELIQYQSDLTKSVALCVGLSHTNPELICFCTLNFITDL